MKIEFKHIPNDLPGVMTLYCDNIPQEVCWYGYNPFLGEYILLNGMVGYQTFIKEDVQYLTLFKYVKNTGILLCK